MIIKNRAELLSHGNIEGRRTVLDIIEAGIAAADPYENTRKLLNLEGDKLTVGPVPYPGYGPQAQTFDMKKVKNIYIVGGGKAVERQAMAFEDILGDRITEGHINIKKGEQSQLKRIGVTFAGHPLPDEDSMKGASIMYNIMCKAKEDDIVFYLRSGGGTSLLALPIDGVSLKELIQVSEVVYFGAGANMPEINTIRNLISVLGLKHQKYVHGATLFEFLADEVPLGARGHVSMNPANPVSPYRRANDIIDKYQVRDKMPKSVLDVIDKADPKNLPPTQEEIKMRPYFQYRVIDPHGMLAAALDKARELGLNASILVTSLNDVEAKTTAEIMADIAQEADTFGRPFNPPGAFIFGGEVLVATGQEAGKGGRNQEFALSAASYIAGNKNIVIASVDSDGTDGPTDVAGAIVDGTTMERIKAAGFDYGRELARHNSNPVFKAIGDTVITGNTGTNLRDIRVIFAGRKS
jgi:glycerate 2-kinase